MEHHRWTGENRKIIVCVDSYQGGLMKGRFYGIHREMEAFCGLPDLLLRVDALLDRQRQPQAYTEPRKFMELHQDLYRPEGGEGIRRGAAATFELQVIFRQHSSWQGILRWREREVEQSFRSVLELIFLMESALRDAGGGVCA